MRKWLATLLFRAAWWLAPEATKDLRAELAWTVETLADVVAMHYTREDKLVDSGKSITIGSACRKLYNYGWLEIVERRGAQIIGRWTPYPDATRVCMTCLKRPSKCECNRE